MTGGGLRYLWLLLVVLDDLLEADLLEMVDLQNQDTKDLTLAAELVTIIPVMTDGGTGCPQRQLNTPADESRNARAKEGRLP